MAHKYKTCLLPNGRGHVTYVPGKKNVTKGDITISETLFGHTNIVAAIELFIKTACHIG